MPSIDVWAGIAGWYVFASVVAFCLYALDKRAAVKGRWRTKEATLQTAALVGGWPGALVAQRLLHHKSRKTSFQVVFWLIVALHVAGWGAFVAWRMGWIG